MSLKVPTAIVPRSFRRRTKSRAVVLILVLIVVVVLALSAYTFCELMFVERRAAEFHGRRFQTRLFAESGIAAVLSSLGSRWQQNQPGGSTDDDQNLFRVALGPNSEGGFTVFAPTTEGEVSFGVLDLSSRLNINVLAVIDKTVAREALLRFHEMTDDVADAILDWIDADDEPRTSGAESSYYGGLDPAYGCRNAPLRSLDELLLVRGVTKSLLYGRDFNRNGFIDPQEEADGTSRRDDDASGNAEGWARWLTVNSGESTLRSDGRAKINLNQPELTDLFDELEREFDVPTAKFIVAYRMYGPYPKREDVRRSAVASRSPNAASAVGGVVETKRRAGLILNSGPRYFVRSLFDLVATQIGYVDETGSLMTSPWSLDASAEGLDDVEDAVTVTSASFIPGRVNLLKADNLVLGSVPEVTEQVASQIIAARAGRQIVENRSMGWLLEDGVVDLDTLRKVAPFLNTGGDVFAGQVIGHHFSRDTSYCRLEFIIDASTPRPRLLRSRDMSVLGPGWPKRGLGPQPK